jgi:hypothetical protein
VNKKKKNKKIKGWMRGGVKEAFIPLKCDMHFSFFLLDWLRSRARFVIMNQKVISGVIDPPSLTGF